MLLIITGPDQSLIVYKLYALNRLKHSKDSLFQSQLIARTKSTSIYGDTINQTQKNRTKWKKERDFSITDYNDL